MTTIDGSSVTGVTIDGSTVNEITVDGTVVWSATTTVSVDNFDDQSMSEYGTINGTFGFTQSPARSGYALSYTNSTQGQSDHAYAPTGLDNYVQQGDRFSIWVRSDNQSANTRQDITFIHDGTGNDYMMRIDNEFDVIFCQAVVGGTQVANDGASFSMSANTWYEFVLEWDDGSTFGQNAGDFRVLIYDDTGTQLQATSWINDTTYDGTGAGQNFGLGGKPRDSTGDPASTFYFDEARITNR